MIRVKGSNLRSIMSVQMSVLRAGYNINSILEVPGTAPVKDTEQI